MGAIAEVVAALDAVHVGLMAQQRETLAVAGRLEDLARRYALLFAATASPYARTVVARTMLAVRQLREGAQVLAGAAEVVLDVRALVAGGVSQLGRPPPVGAGPSSARLRLPGRIPPDRAKADEIHPYVGGDVAVGRLYGQAGEALTPKVGPGDTGAGHGLREPWASMRFVTHVESNATALMRQHGIRSAVLYISMRPCRQAGGCEQNIAATLPVGYRLTIYQVLRSGTLRTFDVKGTGEGIADDRD